jgi:hypothetical protein
MQPTLILGSGLVALEIYMASTSFMPLCLDFSLADSTAGTLQSLPRILRIAFGICMFRVCCLLGPLMFSPQGVDMDGLRDLKKTAAIIVASTRTWDQHHDM